MASVGNVGQIDNLTVKQLFLKDQRVLHSKFHFYLLTPSHFNAYCRVAKIKAPLTVFTF